MSRLASAVMLKYLLGGIEKLSNPGFDQTLLCSPHPV